MIYINKFIDKLKFFDSVNSKDFVMPLNDAKDLHSDITKLLLILQDNTQNIKSESNNVKLKGSDW